MLQDSNLYGLSTFTAFKAANRSYGSIQSGLRRNRTFDLRLIRAPLYTTELLVHDGTTGIRTQGATMRDTPV